MGATDRIEQKVKKNQITQDQHHVWQYYLKAWTVKENFLFRYKKSTGLIRRPSTKSAGVDLFFYAAEELTKADYEAIELVISGFPHAKLREEARRWVIMFQLSFNFRPIIADLPEWLQQQATEDFDYAEKMVGEMLHQQIETNSVSFLKALRERNTDFLSDETVCSQFLFFIFNQYFRTVKIRRTLSLHRTPIVGHDPRRTALIESIIFACQLGAHLFLQWDNYKPIILTNDSSEVPFLTCDQPVINNLGVDGGPTGKSVELYYPVSPDTALIISDNKEKFPHAVRNAGTMEVEGYNFMMFEKCDDEIYSNNKSYLTELAHSMRIF